MAAALTATTSAIHSPHKPSVVHASARHKPGTRLVPQHWKGLALSPRERAGVRGKNLSVLIIAQKNEVRPCAPHLTAWRYLASLICRSLDHWAQDPNAVALE